MWRHETKRNEALLTLQGVVIVGQIRQEVFAPRGRRGEADGGQFGRFGVEFGGAEVDGGAEGGGEEDLFGGRHMRTVAVATGKSSSGTQVEHSWFL